MEFFYENCKLEYHMLELKKFRVKKYQFEKVCNQIEMC